MVTFFLIARPSLLALGGAAEVAAGSYPVIADFDYRKKRDRREYVRVMLDGRRDGLPVAIKHPRDGAGVLSSMVEADGRVELTEDLTLLERGSAVSFLPFSAPAQGRAARTRLPVVCHHWSRRTSHIGRAVSW